MTLNERKIPLKGGYLTKKIEFKKIKKNTPGYLGKEHMYQISDP